MVRGQRLRLRKHFFSVKVIDYGVCAGSAGIDPDSLHLVLPVFLFFSLF